MKASVKHTLIKKLISYCPKVPSMTTKKTNFDLIEELFQMCPETPYTKVSGIDFIKNIKFPLTPKK